MFVLGFHKIITCCLRSGCSNEQLAFTRVYFVDLRNRDPLGQNLCSLNVESLALVRVRKVFGFKDLGCSIFIDERDDEERIVVDNYAIGGREQDGEL